MKKNQNQSSQVRKAVATCQFCGEPIWTGEEFVSANGGAMGNKGSIYAHSECCQKRSYSFKNMNTAHKTTAKGFRFGCEFESNERTSYAKRLQAYAWYGLISTSDCTVEEEFKSCVMQNLHGGKAWLEGLSKLIDISTGDNCGTHIHFSLATWTSANFHYVEQHRLALFGALARYLRDLPIEILTANFGRGFGGYAAYTDYNFVHGAWLNILSDHMELRIARFKTPEQYFHLLCLCKVWALIVDDYINGKNTADKAGRRLVKATKAHIEKTAKYFSDNRNK